MKKFDPIKYEYITTNHNVSIWPVIMLAEMLSFYFYKINGKNYGSNIGEWENKTNRWVVEKDIYRQIAKQVLLRVEINRNWVTQSLKKLEILCKELINFSQKIFNDNLKNRTDKDLYMYYMQYREKYINMYAYGWIPNAIEGLDNIFSKKLNKYLKKILIKLKKEDLLGDYFFILTTPSLITIREKEQIDFFKLLIKLKELLGNRKFIITPAIDRLFVNHAIKYCWLPFDYEGESWNKNYFIKTAKEFFKQGINPVEELNKIKQAKKDLIKKQKYYIKEIDLEKDKKYNYLFKIARDFMWWKNERKDILYKSYYYTDKLIREIARRLSLTTSQVRHILPTEMEDVLLKKNYNTNSLNKRIEHCIIMLVNNKVHVFTDEKAKELDKKFFLKKSVKNKKKLLGQAAFSGIARGVVKIINETKDIAKMNEGDILVSEKTMPVLIPAIKKAVAILTDQGGITCHAAIISRELKIPCIVGTNVATQVLHDGDMVEVDADKGIVKILNKTKK